nr:hypothetical protein [Enterobacter sp.]
MKAEHGRRIASRELTGEFTGLIAELENDRDRAMLGACTTRNKYLTAYDDAISIYAGPQWLQALTAVPAMLVRDGHAPAASCRCGYGAAEQPGEANDAG